MLWLRGQAEAAGTVSTAATAAIIASSSATSALEEVLALQWPLVFKLAGVAAVRRAANTPEGSVDIDAQSAVLVVTMPALAQSCRYIAGAGFAGMVSDVPANERKAVHLMALAAVWRAHEKAVPWPDGVVQITPPLEVVGKVEKQFLQQVQATLQELLRGGLSHVGPSTSARLLALNMSARGEGLPRLAAMLRSLSGMSQGLEARDHRVEEGDALALISRINALCEALAGASGEPLLALRGRLRRAFALPSEQTVLNLLPLGAHWWQTLGGARGLTLSLWDFENKQLLQTTLARPDASDMGFNRESAWNTLAVWPGAGSAATICAAALQLEHPRLSEDGCNIALGGLTRAAKLPVFQANDARLSEMGWGNWEQVRTQIRQAAGLAGEPLHTLLLRPATTALPVLDEAQQQFNWALQDSDEAWLNLSIPCGPGYETRIQNLDRITARKSPILGVLAVVERSGARVFLNPAAVIIGATEQPIRVVSLDYAKEPVITTTMTDRILRMFQARLNADKAAAPAVHAFTLVARLLSPVCEVLETQAATGRVPLTAYQVETLKHAVSVSESVGLYTLATALQAHLAAPSMRSLMRLNYLCNLLIELEGFEI